MKNIAKPVLSIEAGYLLRRTPAGAPLSFLHGSGESFTDQSAYAWRGTEQQALNMQKQSAMARDCFYIPKLNIMKAA